MQLLFIIHPAEGPVNSSLQFAKILQYGGDDIIYLLPAGAEHLKHIVNCSGFKHIFFDPMEKVTSNSLEELLTEFKFEAVVLDADQLSYAIVLSLFSIPKIFINTTVLSEKTAYVPPFSSSYIPDRGWWSYLRVEFEWMKCFLRKRIYYLWNVIASRGKSDIYHKRVARVVGFDLKRNANYKRSWLYGLKTYPEFFLYPSEFDFPRKRVEKNQYFIGPLIDVERHEEPFNWENISGEAPLVYCSLGTLSQVYYPGYSTFLNKLISIFEKQPGFNLILSAGDKMEELKTKAKNIYIYKRVPQLQVLKRASIMITHAGLNSVKECIHFGVPMLAYPIGMHTDQPGNAARVVFHGLGRRGDIRKDSAQRIMTDFLEVYKNPYYRKNIVNMQKIFHQYKRDELSAAEFIESFLKKKCAV